MLVLKHAGHAPPGERLGVVVPAEHVHVFDAASGVRLDPLAADDPPARVDAPVLAGGDRAG